LGTNRVTWGIKVTIATVMKIAMKNGTDSFAVSSGEHSMIVEVVYRAIPTGGVITPKVTQVIIIIPKTTGSTPTVCITGSKIGVKIKAITVVSINIPQISRNPITIINRSVELLVIPTKNVAILVVISSNTTP